MTLDASRQRREAKWAAQGLEGGFEGAKVFLTEAPTPGESPQIEVGGSGKTLPIKTTPNRERVLKTTCEFLGHLHPVHLHTMHKMGSMWAVDQTLARTLMAEFARLQLIVGEDLTKSLLALHLDLEASSEALMSNIVRTIGLHPNDPVARQVKAVLQTFQQST